MSTPGTNRSTAAKPLPLVAATAVLPVVALSSLALAAPASATAPAVQRQGAISTAPDRTGQAAVVPAAEIAALVPTRLAVPQQGGPARAESLQADPPATHTVRAGDTVTAIAAKYGLGVADVLALNGLTPSTIIRPGQVIRLLGAPSAPASPPSSSAPAATQPSQSTTYTIRPGDTLYGISARLSVPLGDLLAANSLSLTSVIYAGRTLKVPVPVGSAEPASSVTPASSEPVKPLVADSFMGYKYPTATVASANENKRLLNAAPVPSRAEMKQIISDTARRMGVDPALALAFAYQESGFSQRAVSPANAIGAMQLVPSSGQWASDLVGRTLNLLDPYDNATAGVAIIRALVRTSKDEDTAIAGYYQGQYSVAKHGLYDDTKQYVAAVKAHKATFS
ncbi:LysM peptidoglycan-binding domain-containing protein [Sinomonas sp. ASV486]|uniref:LysM peptidoglycan-binding domain-containing protein n=1 Tax=Sinomonas sp. ASV486 TaxID=3051170 RepID=UPI0027DC6EAC|nr:LysM peptidoglycan-binding domain-containing protein [Sinomonas sp. ASV486]MDQ4489757.1 LysM peptidoglycan-binding domain-containing protein [Sinomonas sp. ASV486]